MADPFDPKQFIDQNAPKLEGAADLLGLGPSGLQNGQDVMTRNFGYDTSDLQSSYDFTSRVFPLDLGTAGYDGHYMIINIAVSQMSNMSNVSGPGGSFGFTKLSDTSRLDTYRFGIDAQWNAGGVNQLNPFVVPRFTRRIKESIAIMMPETVAYSNRNDYEEMNLMSGAGAALDAIGLNKIANAIKGASTAAGYLGFTVNPRVEVMFKNSQQREFTFEFLMAPRNQAEALAIFHIVKTLRFHQAVELAPLNGSSGLGGAAQSLFYVKPSEFDISFYFRGKENPWIPRIMTCAMVGIDVDYAPSGFASTHRDGSPTHVKLVMMFRELELNHRLRIAQGF